MSVQVEEHDDSALRSAGGLAQRLIGSWSTSVVAGLLLLIVGAWIIFTVVGHGFLSSFNINSLTQLAAEDIVIGFAQAALLVLARMNLAVGGIGVAVVTTCGFLDTSTSLPLGVILLIGLAVGAVAGALIAVAELRSHLSSFIVSLAFLSIYTGGVLLLTKAVHYRISSPALSRLGNGNLVTPYLSPLLGVAVVVGVVMWLLYFHTGLGWRSLAVGANERAAAASGVNVGRVVLAGYVISGLLCAIAGVMEMSRLAEASPATGASWLFPSFIGPVLGGVALSGGEISIGGVFLGALFYDSIASGLVILNVSTYWLDLAQGLVLLGALLLWQLRTALGMRRRALAEAT